MSGRFAGMSVMITGAAGGFGAAAATRFAVEGASLALSDLDKPGLDRLVDDIRAHTKRDIRIVADHIDITVEKYVISHLEHACDQLGGIDVAVNNAGIAHGLMDLQDTPESEFDRVMAVNTKAVFFCMKAQLAHMVSRGSGAILNVASAAGLVGAARMGVYAASKHAVIGLTRSAADEVARHGVRVNALCPSFAPTPLFDSIADEVAGQHDTDRETAYRRITGRIPMRRLARVDEVVQAMLWACDPDNSFMTGQAIPIDGGLTAV